MSSHKTPSFLVYLVIAMVLLGAMALFVVDRAEKSRQAIPVWTTLEDFSLTASYNGQSFGLEDFKGKLSVVYFGFTRCKSICPLMVVNMKELYDCYADYDQVQFVTISVDPDYDSLDILNAYAAEHGVTDNRWVFLRGDIDSIVALCEGQFMLAADDLPMGHSSKWAVVDHHGQVRCYHVVPNPESLMPITYNNRQLAEAMR